MLGNVTILEDTNTQTVNLTGSVRTEQREHADGDDHCEFKQSESIPNPTVNYISPHATGTLTFAPLTNQFADCNYYGDINRQCGTRMEASIHLPTRSS